MGRVPGTGGAIDDQKDKGVCKGGMKVGGTLDTALNLDRNTP